MCTKRPPSQTLNLANYSEGWKRKRFSSRRFHDLSRYCHSDVASAIKGASRRKCSTLSKVLSPARYPLLWLNPILYLLLLSLHLSVLTPIFFFFLFRLWADPVWGYLIPHIPFLLSYSAPALFSVLHSKTFLLARFLNILHLHAPPNPRPANLPSPRNLMEVFTSNSSVPIRKCSSLCNIKQSQYVVQGWQQAATYTYMKHCNSIHNLTDTIQETDVCAHDLCANILRTAPWICMLHLGTRSTD